MADKTAKPQAGAWANMSNAEDRRLKVDFKEFDKARIVTFQNNNPKEIPWEDGVFYVFDVIHNGEEKTVSTSAWSLLRGLKEHEPLEGKTLKITKYMENGKQAYKVENNEETVEGE